MQKSRFILSLGVEREEVTNETKNFRVFVKYGHTFDGDNAADFIAWHENIRSSLNIYDKAVFESYLKSHSHLRWPPVIIPR